LNIPLINSIFENRNGELYFSVNSGTGRFLSKFDGKKFAGGNDNLLKNEKYSGWGWKQTIWHDSSGAWWIPGGEGLYRSPPVTSFEQLSKSVLQKVETGAKGKEVFRLFEDSRGDVWIATTGNANELLRWQRSSREWRDLTEETGFGKFRMGTAFAEDHAGDLWIGTGGDGGDDGDGALIRYRDGNFKIFTQADGAPPGWTRDLFLDSRGRLWLANTDWGLLRLDDTSSEVLNFVRYSTADGLSSRGIYCVTEDEFGRIYAGSGRGLDRLNPDTGQVENFTTADGLPGSFIELAYRDRSNTLWFATPRGLARYLPEPKRIREPPTIFITGLRIVGSSHPVSITGEKEVPNMRLESDKNHVSVDFVGLGASLGEKLRYEYRITSEDWMPTNERTVNFSNLSPGNYVFEVRAVSADRIYSAPAVFPFSISSPLWQQWWFLLSISGLFAGLVYLFYRNRLLRLLEVERMRTRIATDLHDDIGANLTKIAILSEVAHQRFARTTEGADEILPSIAEISRESVSAMGDIVWAINPKKDTLQNLTRRMRQHAREVLERRDISLEFNAPDQTHEMRLDANMRRSIYLIFKESLNNIARHADASAVRIDLEIIGSKFILRITDDGQGFDPESEFDGNGLLSMKKRAADLGGLLELDSSLGEGARVILRFSI
jgi:streptogramin lyase/signal transduction histidine kinase